MERDEDILQSLSLPEHLSGSVEWTILSDGTNSKKSTESYMGFKPRAYDCIRVIILTATARPQVRHRLRTKQAKVAALQKKFVSLIVYLTRLTQIVRQLTDRHTVIQQPTMRITAADFFYVLFLFELHIRDLAARCSSG